MTEQPATSTERHADALTVALHGEVDVLNVDEVRQALTEAVAAAPSRIVVDLADLSFIDSTGLGALIFGFQRARDRDIVLSLSRPTRAVRQVLVISGLLEVVHLTDPTEPPATAESPQTGTPRS